MRITRRQLRRIIKETMLNEALPPHLQKHFNKDGSSVHKPKSEIKDVTPAGYGPDDGGKLLRISGGGEKFAITNTEDYFSTSVYDDDFRDAFISKLEQARGQGYTEVQLSSGPMNTENLTIDEMIQRVEEIEASMY